MTPARRLAFAACCLFWAGALGLRSVTFLAGEPRQVPLVWLLEMTTLGLYGGLTLLALYHRSRDPRVTVFALLGLFVGLTIVFERSWLDAVRPGTAHALRLGYAAVYMLSFPLVIHMAALIPRRHRLIERWPALLWANYALGALAVALGYLLLAPETPRWLDAWSGGSASGLSGLSVLNRATYLWAGLLSLLLLGSAARLEPTVAGRRQALIVFSGVLVWTANVVLYTFFPGLLAAYPALALVEPAAVFLVPVAFFLAIFGFRLFELELFVRKGLIYGLTLGLLAAAIYALWVGAGLLLGRALRLELTPGNTLLLLLAVGLLFEPLRRWTAARVDHLFFREKLELERLQRSILPELAAFADADGAARHLVARLGEALQLASATAFLADEERRLLRVRAVWVEGGSDEGPEAGREAPAGTASEAVLSADELRGEGLDRAPRRLGAGTGAAASTLRRLGARASVPLTSRGELAGFLALGAPRAGADLDRKDLEQLEAIAHQAAAVLDNLRLHDLASTDPLTRLPRRQVFEERLRQELDRGARSGRPLVVGLADLDDFKRLNDSHGHLVGDRALRAVAAALVAGCRSTDLVARFGGEELALLFPETDRRAGLALGEKLRGRVAAARVEVPEGAPVTVTMSIGLCAVDDPSRRPEPAELLGAADEALYRAKARGKDRVELAER